VTGTARASAVLLVAFDEETVIADHAGVNPIACSRSPSGAFVD
jgi:hypothetical protein